MAHLVPKTPYQGIMLMRKRARLGWMWLVGLPLFTFVLFRLLVLRQTQYGNSVSDGDIAVSDDRRAFQQSLVGGGVKSVGLPRPTDIQDHASSGSRIRHYEQWVTKQYNRIQLALSASADSPPRLSIADVGTLRGLHKFQPLLTHREKARLLYTFEVFQSSCKRHNLTFFLMGSSLVGAMRHHGVIPWRDVSISVAMPTSDQAVVRAALDGRADVLLMWPHPRAWSLRPADTPPEAPDLLRQTYIRLQFYGHNASHVWADGLDDRRLFTAPRQQVFPLTLRPFEGRRAPVPCDPGSVLGGSDLEVCRAVVEDREAGGFREAGTVPCQLLQHVYPFVTSRLSARPGCSTEQVSVNGTLLYSAPVMTGCGDVSHHLC